MQAEEIWTSEHIPAPRQFGGFQEVLDRTHFHWSLKHDQRDRYPARVKRRQIDDFGFTSIVADPLAGVRTAQDLNKGGAEFFCLLYFDAGRCGLRQGRNETLITRDRIAMWDSARTAEFDACEAVHQVSLLIPHRTATTIVPGIEDMCGTSIDGSKGLGALLLSHLKQLHLTIGAIDAGDRPAVLRATVELVGAAFRPHLETGGSSFRRALLARVKDYILANLHDPELSPARIAAEFRFSPRYLHRLFDDLDFTVGEWIRRRRLTAAKSALACRSNDGISITEIAMRFGFSDASHFSHSFKQEFGIAPRDARHAARDGTA